MRLRHPIRIQKNTPVQDGIGQPIESWSTYWTGWANVEDATGDERGADPIEGVVVMRAVMPLPRRGRIPQPTDRWLYAEYNVTRTVNIEAVRRMDGRRRMLELTGTEVQSG